MDRSLSPGFREASLLSQTTPLPPESNRVNQTTPVDLMYLENPQGTPRQKEQESEHQETQILAVILQQSRFGEANDILAQFFLNPPSPTPLKNKIELDHL